MGIKLNIVNIILVLLFVVGIIVSAFLLYNLPDTLSKETAAINIDEIPSLIPVLSNVNLAVGATLFIGLAAIILLLFSTRNQDNLKQTFNNNFTKKNKEEKKAEGEAEVLERDIETQEYEKIFSEKISTDELSTKTLTALCKQIEASQAAIYFSKKVKDQRLLELSASYAYVLADSESIKYEYGEGLVGQAAKTGNTAHIQAIPEGYIEIFSGLGHSKPGELLIIPIKNNREVIAVAEIATFKPFSKADIKLAEKVFALLGAQLSKSKTSKTVDKTEKSE